MDRNRRTMWLSKCEESELVDATGLGTGEFTVTWAEPVRILVNASAQSGTSDSTPFGMSESYDLTLVADSNTEGICEGDRMWLRAERPDPSDPSGAYTVERVATSLNSWSFGLRKAAGR